MLTVGLAKYTADERFRTVHKHRSEDWMLQIKRTQPTDVRDYECQINMHPLISTSNILSKTAVPRASIMEPRELFISSGSSMNVSIVAMCTNHPTKPIYLFWLLNCWPRI
ncbi:unnamed protein product [Ixodes hexagonus]